MNISKKQLLFTETFAQTLDISRVLPFSARALLSSSALALSVAVGVALVSPAASAQEVVAPGDTRELTNETVAYTGVDAESALTIGNGATLIGTGATVSTSGTSASAGTLASGIVATNASVNLTGGSVSATGARYTRGVLGAGSTILTNGTDVSTAGANSHAIHAFTGTTATINGGTISTQGADSFALYSQNAGSSITATNVEVITQGLNGFGIFTYAEDATATFNGGSITTSGERGHGAVAGLDTQIDLNGASIATSGFTAWGLVADQANTLITATNTNIVTSGTWSHGAHTRLSDAASSARIELIGGSIRTINETGRVAQDGDGSRSYALFAEGAGASISADGTTIETLGQRAYGAHALAGAEIELSNVSINTNGFMAYGVYASGRDSVITATNVNVTTRGNVGDAAWAYQGGRLLLDGGTYQALGAPNPGVSGETVIGLVALGGTNGVNNGEIDARNVTVLTTGDNAIGVRAGAPVGSDNTSGTLDLLNSTVTSRGVDATAARVAFGSQLTATGSALISEQGIGVLMIDEVTVVLDGTRLEAGKESFVSNLETAGSTQKIAVGAGSVVTKNDGTLLRVTRSADGADGIVTLTLAAGSTSKGNILDEDAKTSGATDLILETGANWSGQTRGVRNLSGASGTIVFEGAADIAGDLSADSSRIVFSSVGGTIAGNVVLTNSTTTGGSIALPITVDGNVSLDAVSALGGNWDIGGNLTSAGTTTPGNSIGLVTVAGNLTLAPTSVYAVEIDAAGNADRIDVGGTATLDGAVTVTPLDGYLIGSSYTILTAGDLGGNTFTGATFTGDSAFVEALLSYDPNNVYVTVQRNGRTYASVASTPNQLAVAGALDGLAITSPLAQAIALSSAASATAAFDQLSGEVHASLRSALIEDSRHIRNAVSDRITRSAGDEGRAVWAAGFGSWGKQDGGAGTVAMDRDTRGGLIGVDTAVGTQGRVGILGGYSTSDLDSARGSADVKSNHAGIYGGFRFGGIGLHAGAAYSWHEVDANRSVAFNGLSNALVASYDAETAQVFGDISYAIPVGTGSVEPFGSLAYVHLNTDGFSETGGAAALSAEREKSNVTFSTLGVRVATADILDQPGVAVRGSAGWRHAFNDRLPTVGMAFAGSSPFTVTGVPLSKDAAVLDIAVDAALSQAALVSVGYSGQIGDRGVDNGVKASLSFRF